MGQGFVGKGQAVVAADHGQGAQARTGKPRRGEQHLAGVAAGEALLVHLEGAGRRGQGIGHAHAQGLRVLAHAEHHHAVAVGQAGDKREAAMLGHLPHVHHGGFGAKPYGGGHGLEGVGIGLAAGGKAEAVGERGRIAGQAVGVGHGLHAGHGRGHGAPPGANPPRQPGEIFRDPFVLSRKARSSLVLP